MTVKAVYTVTDPMSVQCTLKLTMTAGEWQRLHDLLPSGYPAWPVRDVIRDMVQKAHLSLEAEVRHDHG
jgi:hypothetical protein